MHTTSSMRFSKSSMFPSNFLNRIKVSETSNGEHFFQTGRSKCTGPHFRRKCIPLILRLPEEPFSFVDDVYQHSKPCSVLCTLVSSDFRTWSTSDLTLSIGRPTNQMESLNSNIESPLNSQLYVLRRFHTFRPPTSRFLATLPTSAEIFANLISGHDLES